MIYQSGDLEKGRLARMQVKMLLKRDLKYNDLDQTSLFLSHLTVQLRRVTHPR